MAEVDHVRPRSAPRIGQRSSDAVGDRAIDAGRGVDVLVGVQRRNVDVGQNARDLERSTSRAAEHREHSRHAEERLELRRALERDLLDVDGEAEDRDAAVGGGVEAHRLGDAVEDVVIEGRRD